VLSSHVLQEVDLISGQVILIANGMVVAEGNVRDVREEIQEHPSQFLIRCRDASQIASLLFEQDHVTQIQLHDDRLGLLVMTRSRQEFSKVLTRISLVGHTVEQVSASFRLRQIWTITRLQLRRVFFSRRSCWVYLLALFSVFMGFR